MNRKSCRNIRMLLSAGACAAGILAVILAWGHLYQNAVYTHLDAFCRTVLEQDPEAEESLRISLKEYQDRMGNGASGAPFLEAYGYTPEDFRAVPGTAAGIVCTVCAAGFLAACLLPVRQERRAAKKRIRELTGYLERVNTDAPGTLLEMREDEFAHLQDEIYKTVTNLHAARDAALKARENYAEHLADIAHQLKTPVTAALLSLQLSEQASSGKDAGDTHLEAVRRQLERLVWLEETLLTLSKIDAGTLKMEHAPVDLYTLLCLAAENLQELLSQKEVQVEIPDRGSAEMYGDMEWSMEAVMNLMKNCMEYTPAGGKIFCDYGANPLYVWIRIQDDGPGFAAEDLPHLFERFYQGKDAAGGGAGIGLALARSIFELQNGNITARNRPEGGACFEIRIYSH